MSEASELHMDRGIELYEEGKLVGAIAAWREASRLDPEDGYVLNNIGRALWDLGQREAAIPEWREAAHLEPDDGDIYGGLAHALSDSGYSPEALAAVRAAVRLCPDEPSLYVWLGYHLTVEASKSDDKAKGEEARAAFQRAVDLDPSNSYALRSLGQLQWWQGKKREAIEALKAAIAADPSDVEAHVTLAARQSRTGQWRGAMQTILAISDLPKSEERSRYYGCVNRLMLRVQIAFFTATGLAALLVWMRWKKRN